MTQEISDSHVHPDHLCGFQAPCSVHPGHRALPHPSALRVDRALCVCAMVLLKGRNFEMNDLKYIPAMKAQASEVSLKVELIHEIFVKNKTKYICHVLLKPFSINPTYLHI